MLICQLWHTSRNLFPGIFPITHYILIVFQRQQRVYYWSALSRITFGVKLCGIQCQVVLVKKKKGKKILGKQVKCITKRGEVMNSTVISLDVIGFLGIERCKDLV